MASDATPFDRLMAEGRAHAQVGRMEEARVAFRAAAERRPQALPPMMELLRLAQQGQTPAQYRALLEEACVRFPNAAFLRLRLGRLNVNENRLEEATAAAEEAFRLAPDAGIVLHATKLMSDAGQHQRAVAMLDEAETRFPAAPELQWRRLDWRIPPLAPMDDLAARQAIARDPRVTPEILFRFVELAASLGAFAEAEAALGRIDPQGPHEAGRKAMRLGHLRLQAWRLAEAAQAFSGAMTSPDYEVDALEQLIRIHIMCGDVAEGIDRLHQLFARSRLKRLQGGLSARPMHSFLGSILNEGRLRGEEIVDFQKARARSPQAALACLREALAARPISTPLAMMATVMMREEGYFSASASPGASPIPRRIMQFWHSDTPPDDIAVRMESWRRLNPHWQYDRFTARSAVEFLAAHYPEDVVQAFRLAGHVTRRVDLFRFAYLNRMGGCYVDADSLALAPLEDAVPGRAELFLYQESMGSIANDFVGGVAAHPLFGACVEGLVAVLNSSSMENTWAATGPGFLTRTAVTAWAQPGGMDMLSRSAVLPRAAMERFMSPNLPASYKQLGHYWLRADFGARAPA